MLLFHIIIIIIFIIIVSHTHCTALVFGSVLHIGRHLELSIKIAIGGEKSQSGVFK